MRCSKSTGRISYQRTEGVSRPRGDAGGGRRRGKKFHIGEDASPPLGGRQGWFGAPKMGNPMKSVSIFSAVSVTPFCGCALPAGAPDDSGASGAAETSEVGSALNGP